MPLINRICSCFTSEKDVADDDGASQELGNSTQKVTATDTPRTPPGSRAIPSNESGPSKDQHLPSREAAATTELGPTPRVVSGEENGIARQVDQSQHAPGAMAKLPESLRPALAIQRLQQMSLTGDEIVPVRGQSPDLYANVRTALDDRQKLFDRLRSPLQKAAPTIS